MQRVAVIALLALVACANAQLFQQNYDYRGSLRYQPVAGNVDGSIAFAGALQYLPPAEFSNAIRFTQVYTQTIRPARNMIVAIDARSAAFSQSQVTLDNNYLIIAAVSDNSMYQEGNIVVVANPTAAPCFGQGIVMALNSPLPNSFTNNQPTVGATSCLISESNIIATLSFQTGRGMNVSSPLGLQNFNFIRRDRTIFGPTVF